MGKRKRTSQQSKTKANIDDTAQTGRPEKVQRVRMWPFVATFLFWKFESVCAPFQLSTAMPCFTLHVLYVHVTVSKYDCLPCMHMGMMCQCADEREADEGNHAFQTYSIDTAYMHIPEGHVLQSVHLSRKQIDLPIGRRWKHCIRLPVLAPKESLFIGK